MENFNWNAAAKLGMESVELEYSGKHGFIETEMYWPINHMVTPAEDALILHIMPWNKRHKKT